MNGWHISVFRQIAGRSSPAKTTSLEMFASVTDRIAIEETRLAVWQAGWGGLRWLDELVVAGHAIDLGGNGYPNYYTAKAESLLLVIADGPPAARETWISGEHDVLTSGWEGKTVIDPAVADACQPDEWLLVVAWDES
jgi:hypothetical protein